MCTDETMSAAAGLERGTPVVLRVGLSRVCFFLGSFWFIACMVISRISIICRIFIM